MNIALIFGGKSAEYEISLISAKSIYENIDRSLHTVYLIGISKEGEAFYFDGSIDKVADGSWLSEVSEAEIVFYDSRRKPGLYLGSERLAHFDLFFPVMHGPFGEDGKVQGLLELSGIPYVGCGVLASAVSMDKEISKRLFAAEGLCQVDYEPMLYFEDMEEKIRKVEERIGYPCFVKPANMGSTIGISKVRDQEELRLAMQTAFIYDEKLLIEQAVDAREIEVSVLGNIEQAVASAVGEIIPSFEFYDYEAKYKSGTSKLIIPADLDSEVSEKVRQIALTAYRAIGAEGLSRVDFFIDKRTGKIYINEINSMPGFTPISMYPKLWEYSGISYPELINRLIELGIRRKLRKGGKNL